MSGEHRRFGGWLLPAIVVLVGAYFLITLSGQGALQPVALRPVQYAGIAAMIAGVIAAVAIRKNPIVRLAGVLACGIGAILVICL